MTIYPECFPSPLEETNRDLFNLFYLNRSVSELLCASSPKPHPLVRPCSEECSVRWNTKLYSNNHEYTSNDFINPCSARCGEGYQVVYHVCEEFVLSDNQEEKSKGIWQPARLGEVACQNAGLGLTPSKYSHTPCQGLCLSVFWIVSNWSEVSFF